MREKRNILISIGLGAILGWTLGFLRLPFLEKNYSFLLGFIACLSIVLLGLLTIFIWKKNVFLVNLFSKKSSTPNSSKTYSFLSFLISLLIVVGGLASSFLIFQQFGFFKNKNLDKQATEQLELMASTRKSNALVLINNLSDKIDAELKSNPERILSDEIIERIAALNHSFEPYRYLEGNQLSEEKWSYERGQLLLILAKMDIDSSSFSQLKSKVSFLGADLFGVDLSGLDLSDVDLRQANLENAILKGSNLNSAILTSSSLKNVNLNKANLQKSNLKNANMQWANLDEANLNEANFNGADLRNAKLRAVESKETNFTWANLTGVFLNNSDLTNANLKGANLERVNLIEANLTKTNLSLVNLKDANLTKAKLVDTKFDRTKISNNNWFEELANWEIIGIDKIKEKYKIDYHNPTQRYLLREK